MKMTLLIVELDFMFTLFPHNSMQIILLLSFLNVAGPSKKIRIHNTFLFSAECEEQVCGAVQTRSRSYRVCLHEEDGRVIIVVKILVLFLSTKCSTKNHSGSLSVCLHQLFCHLLKKSSGNPYLKICDLTNIFLWIPLLQHFLSL